MVVNITCEASLLSSSMVLERTHFLNKNKKMLYISIGYIKKLSFALLFLF